MHSLANAINNGNKFYQVFGNNRRFECLYFHPFIFHSFDFHFFFKNSTREMFVFFLFEKSAKRNKDSVEMITENEKRI